MRASRWMRFRVLLRALWAKFMRARGISYPFDETHPAGLRFQPSDLNAVRSALAPVRLARAKHGTMDVDLWQQRAREKLTELLSVETGDVGWTGSWTRVNHGVSMRRVYLLWWTALAMVRTCKNTGSTHPI